MKRGLLAAAIAVALAPAPAQAKAIHYGLAGGLNWSTLRATDGLVNDFSLSSFSYMGSFSLSFFQDKVLGFRLATDYGNIDRDSGGTSYRSRGLYNSVMPTLNFDLLGNRHSIGVGYAYIHLFEAQGTGLGPFATERGSHSLVLEGKDMWKITGNQYFFLSARVFFWEPFSNNLNLLGGVTLHAMAGVDL